MPGTEDWDGEYGDLVYTGGGLTYENFEERYWCDYIDDYCRCAGDRCEEVCRGCSSWDNAHPYCDIAQRGGEVNYICEDPDYCSVEDGTVIACSGNCEGCPMWEAHHQHSEEELNKEEESATATEENTDNNTHYFTLKSNDLPVIHPKEDICQDLCVVSEDNITSYISFNNSGFTVSAQGDFGLISSETTNEPASE